MKNDMDDLLNQILTPEYEPGDVRNQKVLNRVKENQRMKQHKKQNGIKAAAIAAVCFVTVSATAYAAVHFLGAKEAAKQLNETGIAERITEADVQYAEQEGFRFAYLGTVSGENIREYDTGLDTDETYMVLAAEKTDGTEIDPDEVSFVASPLIQGLKPDQYNIYSMGGGAVYDVIQGKYYMILSCRNIEMFADRAIYAAITTGPDYRQAYAMNAETGLISEREDFAGLNVLFPIELDKTRADKAAQEQYLAEFGKEEEADSGAEQPVYQDAYMDRIMNAAYSELDDAGVEAILQLGELVEKGTVQEKDGGFSYAYDNEYTSGNGFAAAECFEEGKKQICPGGSEDSVTFEYTCMHEGTLDYAIYHYDREQIQAVCEILP